MFDRILGQGITKRSASGRFGGRQWVEFGFEERKVRELGQDY